MATSTTTLSGSDIKLAQYLSPLGSLPKNILSRLISVTIAFLIQPSKEEYTTQLSELVEVGTSDGVTVSSFKSAAQGCLVLLQEMIDIAANARVVMTKCISLGLTNQTSTVIATTWESWNSKINSHLLSRILTKNKLIDMDWSFGVTAASDESDFLGKTFLQLKLTIEKDSHETQVVFMELSLDQFYQFLASLEKCRAFLNYVSPR